MYPRLHTSGLLSISLFFFLTSGIYPGRSCHSFSTTLTSASAVTVINLFIIIPNPMTIGGAKNPHPFQKKKICEGKVAAPRFDRGTSGCHRVSMGPARYTSCAMLLRKFPIVTLFQSYRRDKQPLSTKTTKIHKLYSCINNNNECTAVWYGPRRG